jgi:hypothetical protein
MQTSVVNYKELNFELRIDVEYHKAEVLDNLHLLMKCIRTHGHICCRVFVGGVSISLLFPSIESRLK